jgi:EAL domain-containing protein (putative c-di-GMP-specific phosphodiesterase class I)
MLDLERAEGARSSRCGACAGGLAPLFPFSMAFQPIVDLEQRRIYAYEALVRGPQGEPAATVLDQVTPANRYAFDQSCRIKAIATASRLGLDRTGASLSINFIPGAMYEPENCVRATLAAIRRTGLPMDRLIFELTENEQVRDVPQLERIFATYRRHRMRVALDDFGAGFSGLSLLARFQPDVVKIDMSLLRGLDSDSRRHAIVQGMVGICRDLGTDIVAEGVESHAELAALRELGITLFQGYLFARPGFECLPEVGFK